MHLHLCYVFYSIVFITTVTVLAVNDDINESDDHKKSADENADRNSKYRGPKVVINIQSGKIDGYMINYDDLGQQEPVNPKEIGGIVIQNEAKEIAKKLRVLANNELGVLKMQSIFDKAQYSKVEVEYGDKLNQFVENLQQKLDKYLSVLRTNKITVENLYKLHLRTPISHVYECCNVPRSDLSYDSHYHCPVTRATTCDLVPPNAAPDAFNPGRNLTEVFQHIFIWNIKWQYFISSEGIHTEFPAHGFGNVPFSQCKNRHDQRHRSEYIATAYPKRKNIMIVIDNGNSLSANQFSNARAIAQHVISSLSENDRVGVFGLSSKPMFARKTGCLATQLCPITIEAQLYLNSFISRLMQMHYTTNHSLGFEQAFKMIWNTLNPDNKTISEEKAEIVYISRGLLSTLAEAKAVLKIIAHENGRLRNQVVINTYFLLEEGRPVMYETTVLRDIAQQNFAKFKLEAKHPAPVPVGTMVEISSPRDLSTTVGNFSASFHWPPSFSPRLSLPLRDTVGAGVVVPLTWPCRHSNNQMIGMVGLDIHLSDIAEDVTYFNREDESSYAFLISDKGYTIMHPSLMRPIIANTQPVHTDIVHLEQVQGFQELREVILKTNGSRTMNVLRYPNESLSSYPQQSSEVTVVTITYSWKHVYVEKLGHSPYIFIIKQVQEQQARDINRIKSHTPKPEIVYHRIDLILPKQRCLHMKQLATMDTSTLYMAASSFSQPFEHLSNEETKRMAQGYVLYFKDNTGMLQNSDIKKEGIENDIATIARINDEWIDQYTSSSMNDYIVRRYVATPSGAFYQYPGTLQNKLYSPLSRDWYTRALAYPGMVTMTAPYLDNGGAGYIVTISHTVYQGKSSAMHGPTDPVQAVMGMDLTLGYFYKLLLDEVTLCGKAHIRCFLMDDRGYLVAHPGLIESNGRGPTEEKHVTRKEALVANDILSHTGFVQKRLCNGYNDRTIQRFYQFNTTVDTVFTNLVHGEHCSKYQIAALPGTNLFVGVVNQTCNMKMAFCPCSMIDRLCLNCARMEQTECECPCECPLEMDFCTGDLLDKEDRNPTCPTFQEDIGIEPVPEKEQATLQQCYNPRCEDRKTWRSCLGVVDCAWCEYDVDGVTPLKQPFCSTQRTCFAGVMGARTLYDDGIVITREESGVAPPTVSSTPVGPVAGGIMACFLVMALGIYCYRHRVHRHSHNYITAGGESQYRMGFEDPIEDLDPENEPNRVIGPGGHTNIVLATFDSPVSPYRVNADYRRPGNGNATESDLGYSTMTPHEDSEQASTCVEPISLIGRERYRPSPFSAALTTLKTSLLSSTPSSCDTPILPPPPSARRSQSPLVNISSDCESGIEGASSTVSSVQNCGSHREFRDPLRHTAGKTVLSPLDGVSGSGLSDGVDPSQTVLSGEGRGPNVILAPVQVHMVDSH